MVGIPNLDLEEYNYPLPEHRIAQFPLLSRDSSKLLYVNNDLPMAYQFKNIPELLPENALLIYNQTRVVQARLLFRKETGALIELFCLEPVEPTREIQQAFECTSGVVWKCLVGNSKKWKDIKLRMPFISEGKSCFLFAERIEKNNDQSLCKFTWDPQVLSFSEVLQQAGKIPLPPYMHREAEQEDKIRYQTIFATDEGSVAAPTAGLHFTPEVLNALDRRSIKTTHVTLHVGAGTFKPVSSLNLKDHEMHTEKIYIQRDTIDAILNNTGNPVILTGTTTMRTIESLYWHGVKLLIGKADIAEIDIHQWDPYEKSLQTNFDTEKVLKNVLEKMNQQGLKMISGQTRLMIVPGYDFKIADILITNFHMPRSTLLMLVAAFIGDDWKKAYQFALDNEFRFLSYGDSCLFFRKD